MSRPPFRRVLVANRGEIAVRVLRACRDLGIEGVAVYGPEEERALHVQLADDAYRIPSDAPIPYLDIPAVIAIAEQSGAEAIHPGYGFLSENAAFAEACAGAGLVFVGPPPEAIRAGVPVVPGSDGPVASIEEAVAASASIGFPLAVKASGGGGGRGFRIARTPEDLADAFTGAVSEATRSFAIPDVYLERYLDRARHVEIQLIAGADGEVVITGERDCSSQRRHQTLIEETPAPHYREETRAAMFAAAVALAKEVGYRNAGTIEFMLDADDSFHFLEMNTRIQVEHPISEAVTGLDLVTEQLRVAAGNPLSFTQSDVQPRGHAIECRVNAEDPGRSFSPAPGRITAYRLPSGPGIRVESAFAGGSGPEMTIPTRDDSLIAKVVAWGRTRDEAIARMQRALAEFVVEGVPTTIPFHRNVLAHPAFVARDVATTFITDHPEDIPPPSTITPDPGAESNPARDVITEVNGRRFVVPVSGLVEGYPAAGTHRRTPNRTAPKIPSASTP
ncbi:MAG: acetyl/propionyl/methylcrotonyl-CoA carboxylase subunit alpha, partial [Chloroflexota bacterium]